MQSQRLNISLPKKFVEQFHNEVPAGKRSEFIMQALQERLQKKRNLRQELIKSLKANRALDQKMMKDWAPIEVEGWPD